MSGQAQGFVPARSIQTLLRRNQSTPLARHPTTQAHQEGFDGAFRMSFENE